MVEALLLLLFGAHFLAAIAVPLVPPILMTVTGHRVRAALLLYLAALAFLATWVVASYRAGVAADEQMTQGSLFAASGWLALSTVAAVASAVVTLTGRRRAPGHGQHAGPGAQ